jgi:hypothetical protein
VPPYGAVAGRPGAAESLVDACGRQGSGANCPWKAWLTWASTAAGPHGCAHGRQPSRSCGTARTLCGGAPPNSEPKLRELLDKLQSNHGTVLVVVDQPASIGALPLTVARDTRCQVAYLPGLTVRRIADLYPGKAKTDARDAHVIAVAARAPDVDTRAVESA